MRSRTSNTLAAAILLSVSGCAPSHPGVWAEAEAEAKIKEKMSLQEIDLTPSPEGFTGTGKNAEGESFELTVKQDKDAKRLDYNAKGDRGYLEDGFFEG